MVPDVVEVLGPGWVCAGAHYIRAELVDRVLVPGSEDGCVVIHYGEDRLYIHAPTLARHALAASLVEALVAARQLDICGQTE